jgi:integrase
VLPHLAAEMMQLFLDAFAREHATPGKRVVLVVDGASAHRARSLRVPERVTLVSLPAYTPELNPTERLWPLPKEVKEAVDHYIRLDGKRREVVHSGGADAHLFQPVTNYRTLEFSKALSTRMVQKIVKRWADYSRLGDLSPHDLRRTAITRALESGLTYRQVQMMSKHKDPKTVMRYDHGRENLDQNAVNFLVYDEE